VSTKPWEVQLVRNIEEKTYKNVMRRMILLFNLLDVKKLATTTAKEIETQNSSTAP
jgi:hypothetical protein